MTRNDNGKPAPPQKLVRTAVRIVLLGIAVLSIIALALLAATIAPTATFIIASGLALLALVGFIWMWVRGF